MSYDFPASVERDIELYARSEDISPAEAAVMLVREALKSKRTKMGKVLVTDEQINQLKALDTSFGLLEDVPEEKIDRMSATIRRTKRERFTSSA